jgi:hypothetical protein
VGHLSEGTLRRLHDEPLSAPAAARRHYMACAECHARFERVAADAREAVRLLEVPAAAVDARAALARLSLPDTAPRRPLLAPLAARIRIGRPVQAALIAAVLVGAFSVAAVSQGLIPVMQPAKSVKPVTVTSSDVESLRGMPNLSSYGTVKVIVQPELKPGTAADAAKLGLALPARSSLQNLPANVPAEVNYAILSEGQGSFTFDAAKAAAAAAAAGKPAPAMPKGMDGSTLTLTVGPAAAEIFGPSPLNGGSASEQVPALVIAESRAPVVTSTGVTATQLENFLAAQPGVSPALAAQIRSIGDPITSLPLIIPADRASEAQVTLVDGATAVVVGDNTGLGSGVIWVRNGIVYGVAGSLTKEQNLAIANQIAEHPKH